MCADGTSSVLGTSILRNIASVITYVSLLILEVVFRINASRDNSQPGRGSLDGSFVGGHPKRQSPRLPPLLVQVSQVYPLDKRGTCQTMNQVKRRPSSASQNWTPAYLVVRSTITESAVRFALCLDFQYSGGGGRGKIAATGSKFCAKAHVLEF